MSVSRNSAWTSSSLGIRCRRRFAPRARGRARVAWPNKKRRIGEAWSSKNSADQSYEVFISPVLKDPIEVAATLVHELVHCAVGVETGHKGRFPRLAKAIGLGRKDDRDHGQQGVGGPFAAANGRHWPVSARRIDPLERTEETGLSPAEGRLAKIAAVSFA